MARFSGIVGYSLTVNKGLGKHVQEVTERMCRGTIVRTSSRVDGGDKVNPDFVVQNSISIVADAFARDKFFAIKYVIWRGVAWSVTSVQVEHPRLILQLGEVYNGIKGEATPSP